MAVIDAVVVGCSAGGFEALEQLLPTLPVDFRPPLVVVSHTASSDVLMLVELLARRSALPVAPARERTPVAPGQVHVAPSGYHLLITEDQRFALSVDPRVRYVRPAIDVLFESAAWCYRRRLVAVVLTGANDDGADGLVAVRAHGGIGIVQNPAEAVASVMPAAAIERAGADHIVPLAAIAPLLQQLVEP
jgi:Chemotaxis response regulator containing a CheY-like receiver domain and a methylesterase domain